MGAAHVDGRGAFAAIGVLALSRLSTCLSHCAPCPRLQCTPTAVEQELQKYVDAAGPGHLTHVPKITQIMCKLPASEGDHAAVRALKLLKRLGAQVTPQTTDHPDDLRIIVDDMRAFVSVDIPHSVRQLFPQAIESLLSRNIQALGPHHSEVRSTTRSAPWLCSLLCLFEARRLPWSRTPGR